MNNVDLHIEHTGGTNLHRDLSIRLGAWRHVCDTYYFAIDETAADDAEVAQAVAHLLDQWADQVRLLQPAGGTAYLPFDFSDQYTGWFRATSADGLTARVEAGWSSIEGWSFYPSDIAETAQSVSDFKVINGASIECSVDDLLTCIVANRDALRTNSP